MILMIFKLILKNFYAKHISFWGWPIGQKSKKILNNNKNMIFNDFQINFEVFLCKAYLFLGMALRPEILE